MQLTSDRNERLFGLSTSARGSVGDAFVAAAAALAGIVAFLLGPLYLLPILAIASWYVIARIATAPAALIVWAAAFSLLGEKMFLTTGLGEGLGLLRLGPLLSLMLLAGMLVVDSRVRQAATDLVRWGTPAALFVAFGTVLPIVGVIVDYPLRTATAVIVPLATGAFLVFGVLVARSGLDHDRVRYLSLVVVTTVAALVGLLLFLNNRGITLPLATAIDQWGIATAEAYGTTWLKRRVGGLYTNPNMLGTLGGLALVYAAFGRLLPRQRLTLLLPGLVILFVTQSRSVLLGAMVAIAVGLLFTERRLPEVRWQTVLLWTLVVLLAFGAVAGAAALFPQWVAGFEERITTGMRILVEGAAVDRNFAARIAFWGSAWELMQQRVLGTFGPPELMLGTAVDNDYLRFALQGGFLYAGTWVFYLAWLVRTGLFRGTDRFIGVGAVFLAITSLTHTPSTYVMVIGMFSLFAGMHVERIRIGALGADGMFTSKTAGDV